MRGLGLAVWLSNATLLAPTGSAQELPVTFERLGIGGATTTVATFQTGGVEWAAFNTANRLRVTRAVVPRVPIHELEVEGFIRDIELVSYDGREVALLATGSEGIVAVDVTSPGAMQVLATASVNYYQSGISWTEGGGDIVPDNEVSGTRGTISSLLSDGVDLWIGNLDFGLQRTALANLIGSGGPVLEPDGTLAIDAEVYTLQYAGENPWGGPQSLTLFGGKLFLALGYLGVGIFDPQTLEQVGGYNLYTDAGVLEDWFVDMDVANEVQPGFLDPFTGMPDYNQVSFEILQVWHGGIAAPTPWSDFDRYGKHYYDARQVAVSIQGNRALAYVAYGLAGLVALDVTGFDAATGASYLTADYLGYAPAAPAKGPEEPTQQGGGSGGSLFPHYGEGMLKEAGAVGVALVGGELFYTDHFAGLVVLAGAEDPAGNWHGDLAPYDNDDPSLGDGVLGDHWPDYEFVTSYDMTPSDPTDSESLPRWMFEAPCLLVTGEIGGHGNRFVPLAGMDTGHAGGIDLLVSVGAGGLDFLDVSELVTPGLQAQFGTPKYLPTTEEAGLAADGLSKERISIGHSQGMTIANGYLYLADGPHGVSAWRVDAPDGTPIKHIHLVANTLQDEYPVTNGTTTVYPTPHAYGVVYDAQTDTLLTLCQGRGMRRLDVSAVQAGLGQVGHPLLLEPALTDIFEHNTEAGSVAGTPKQDHAYDVALSETYAFVADGGNGLTVYDLTKDPTDLESGFLVSNLGGSAGGKAELGRSTGIALWFEGATQKRFAILAAGPRGVGVVDATDPANLQLVKVFEPIKIEDGQVGHADGRAVDVLVLGRYAYVSYDSFGILCYALGDLIEPLPAGVDPTDIWKVQGGAVLYDYRPVAVSRFRLADVPGYEDIGGGALNMDFSVVGNRLRIHAAYGTAGVVEIDWRDAASPLMFGLAPTPGEATSVVEYRGRLFVADGAGGLVYFE